MYCPRDRARSGASAPAGHPQPCPRSVARRPSLEALAYVADQVHGAAGVAPLVVVPAEDLDRLAVGHGELRVEDAACRVADDVRTEQGGVDVLKDVLQFAFGRPLES